MDSSKLYVPDPQKWVKFYRNMADGKFSLYSSNQVGGGQPSQFFITPIDSYVDKSESSEAKRAPIKLVSPSEQTVSQAKSELEREGQAIKATKNKFKAYMNKGIRKTQTKRKSSKIQDRTVRHNSVSHKSRKKNRLAQKKIKRVNNTSLKKKKQKAKKASTRGTKKTKNKGRRLQRRKRQDLKSDILDF